MLKLVVAASALFVTVNAASAEQARERVHWSSFLRAGPGANFGVIDEVDGGEAVPVLGCVRRWCLIIYGDAKGYIEQDALTLQRLQEEPTSARLHDCVTVDGVGWRRPVRRDLCVIGP